MLDALFSPLNVLPPGSAASALDPLLSRDADPETRIKAVAASFEEMLILNLVKTAFREEKKDNESSFSLGGDFNGLHNQMLAKYIAENGGLGYQEIIAAQIRDKMPGITPPGIERAPAVTNRPLGSNQVPLRPVAGRVTSNFGWRRDPFTDQPAFHRGIDLAAPDGTPVTSSLDGTVTYSGRRPGYGNLVKIHHGRGLYTHYAHLSERLVKKGDKVKSGQTIALSGSDGRSTAPHLHFEVQRNGRYLDPAVFMAADTVNEKVKRADLLNSAPMEVSK